MYFDNATRVAIYADLGRVLRECSADDAHAQAAVSRIVENIGEYPEFPSVADLRAVLVETNPTKPHVVGCALCLNQIWRSRDGDEVPLKSPGWIHTTENGNDYYKRCRCNGGRA